MAADVLGCFGYMFTDFIEHVVRDSNGENPNVRVITDITSDEKGVVTVLAPPEPGARRYGINESDHDGFVEIDDVAGMVDSDGNSINDNVFKSKPCTRRTRKVMEKGKRFSTISSKLGIRQSFQSMKVAE